jgi:L-ascorbate metabolism protein UlaG (beta-lactamase superfamily)
MNRARKIIGAGILISLCLLQQSWGATKGAEMDTIQTKPGKLVISFIGHATLMMSLNGFVIHIDPVGRYADYSKTPKADLVLITHEHGDHLDPAAVALIRKSTTAIILTKECAEKLGEGTVVGNGDTITVKGMSIEAVPAYNIVHMRSPGIPFHPEGAGNGYVINFGGTRVYVAGDTENIPEMSELKNITVAFLPMNLPYTMTPEMIAEAARRIRPKILYPYHYGETDPSLLVKLLEKEKDIEVRIRELQ